MSFRDQLEGLIEFAEKATYTWGELEDETWTRGEQRILFQFTISGDPTFFCFRDKASGGFMIQLESGGSLSEPLILSDHLEDIEKFLSFEIGNEARWGANNQFTWLELDTSAVDLKLGGEFEGFHFEGTVDELTMSWQEGDTTRIVGELDDSRAKDFVRYMKFSAEEIRNSFLDKDGHPLFTAN